LRGRAMWVREAWEWQSHDLADRTLAAYWRRTLTVLLCAVYPYTIIY
jgi:hypothetical protein